MLCNEHSTRRSGHRRSGEMLEPQTRLQKIFVLYSQIRLDNRGVAVDKVSSRVGGWVTEDF
jgi:hypothetical protein